MKNVKNITFLLFFLLTLSRASAQCVGTLVWSDEFNGTSLDFTKWAYETGNGCPALCGWGNNEMEYYTTSANNIRVTGGNLVLEARAEVISGSPFSSGKIISRNIAYWTYGRFEARMRMPEGRGLWPAFWMLPEVNNWPTTGEIDIMEYRGDLPTRTSATLHYGNPWPGNLWDGADYFHTASLASAFNLYAAEWDANEIRWYFNDRLFKIETRTPNTLNPASNNANVWPWNTNFHFLLNLAVGGWFPATTNPADVVLTKPTFEIDYVRVYNMASAVGTQWPYNGTPAPIPGKIEAEEYDRACDQAAYYDVDLANQGGAFRGERVDIENTADVGGGYNIGWTAAGEWMEYTVNVAANGTYDFLFRLASDGGGGRLHVEMDGVNISGAVNLPNTFGWGNWQNYSITNRTLTAGNHIMRVYVENAGFNLNYITVSTNTLLPISLIDFTADEKDGFPLLQWSTAYERNNSYFTIESSSNGYDWSVIATMPSKGNSESVLSYEWLDKSSQSQLTYYRLKQTDINNESSYSDIIKYDKNNNFSIAPNPFSEETIIQTTILGQSLSIYDVTGSLVERVVVDSEKVAVGKNLSKGIYFIKNSSGEIFKLIKQ